MRLFVLFTKRGGGHFIVAIDAITAIDDSSEGSVVVWSIGNEVGHKHIQHSADQAWGLIAFEQEKARTREAKK